jgi:glycosyltransferase involved in cell wall biosynthesis
MAGALSGAAYGLIESVLGWAATDALIAVSPEEAEHARSLGIAASKIHLAPNGVDPFLSESRVEVRAELGLQEDHIAVGFVGRLTWQKDPLRFCHAIAHAQQRDSRIIGVMVGDGDLAEAVRATGGPVLFLGWREARAVMSAFDVLAVTSRYEGMPYVFLEALQAGLPIVSTEVGGSRLAIRPGENGFVAPRDATPAVFGEALLALGDDALRARMAEASQRLAPNFTTERMISATERVYEQALSGKPALVRPQTVQTAKGYARA